MDSNLTKYRQDLERLISRGDKLHISMQSECYPEEIRKALGDKADELIDKLPSFNAEYQSWYSEAKVLIKQLLPDRLLDFERYYEKPKTRKKISYENYRIEDYLQSLNVTYGVRKVAGPEAAIPLFRQQQAILKSVLRRFESSLFDIRQLVQADLLDSELASSQELLKKGFLRASGAVAGVVLEKHLAQVLKNHDIKTRKKNPSISDFNDLLKKEGVLDTPAWRQIQHLGDIRNLCDHNKEREPSADDVQELIDGVAKIIKTLF